MGYFMNERHFAGSFYIAVHIAHAIGVADSVALGELAHGLKGAGCNMSANRFAALAKQLEDIDRQGSIRGLGNCRWRCPMNMSASSLR
jgi:HPt (histidine-containing phosphotransfer) domain-containing protein